MQVTVEPRDHFTILHLRGAFDTFYCALLQKEIEGLSAAGVNRIALNLRLVEFINSTALGAIIKASKFLAAKGGKLVISRPSDFCKGVLEKVGLERVVPMYESDEAAGIALLGEPSAADKGIDAKDLEDETTILFAPMDAQRIAHFVPPQVQGVGWRGVGRMSSLDTVNVRFTWNGGNTGLTPFEMGQFLSLGTDLNVKFRIPLLKRGYCEAVVTVSEVEERPEGVKLAAVVSQIEPEALAAVKQYAADMAFLRRELPSVAEGDVLVRTHTRIRARAPTEMASLSMSAHFRFADTVSNAQKSAFFRALEEGVSRTGRTLRPISDAP